MLVVSRWNGDGDGEVMVMVTKANANEGGRGGTTTKRPRGLLATIKRQPLPPPNPQSPWKFYYADEWIWD